MPPLKCLSFDDLHALCWVAWAMWSCIYCVRVASRSGPERLVWYYGVGLNKRPVFPGPQHLCPFALLPSVWLLPVASETDALCSCGSHAAAGQKNLGCKTSLLQSSADPSSDNLLPPLSCAAFKEHDRIKRQQDIIILYLAVFWFYHVPPYTQCSLCGYGIPRSFAQPPPDFAAAPGGSY